MGVSKPTARRQVLLFAAVLPLSCFSARAQLAPPMTVLEPKDTVQLEHHDRKRRLLRLSGYEGIMPPQFLEYEVPADQHHLAEFPVPMPVLRVIYRDTVFFDFGKADLKPDSAVILNTIAESLRAEPPDVTVFVAGHTDDIGSVDFNLNLGLDRAETVARALARMGVNRSQIFRISFGKSIPIETNQTEDGRAHNRRVEFLFAARPEPIAAWLARQPVPACSANNGARGSDCPAKFVAKRVPSGTPHSHNDGSPPTPGQPPVVIDSSGAQPKDIDTHEEIVEIDPSSQIFIIRAPE
jgi:OOP family OmpA-OmpF porin